MKTEVVIWDVPYDVEVDGNNYTLDNPFGTNAIDILKRKNDWNEPVGDFYDYFGISVDEEDNKITVSLYDKSLELHDNEWDLALTDALATTSDYYDDIGWEFLQRPKRR